ncbi:hypothetical protein [Pseudoalteromonas mariniglutinosa]|uniref:hypothetical protein n=1 Tax=Pseudoalteromonas mariniglutinosa TaxID=206042 RepID=UPI00384C549D
MKNRPNNQHYESEIEQQRAEFYRTCIAEFQLLGYQDQYLAKVSDDMVPLLGVELLNSKGKPFTK